MLQIIDSDDHATRLDVVPVPEGFSFQTSEREQDPDSPAYLSVIVSPADAERMIEFLQTHREGYTRPRRSVDSWATARGEVGPGG